MWSCLLVCQICMIILVAVDLFNKENRKVKGFLELVPTSIFWLWSKQSCCSDVHTFSTFCHLVLPSVNSQLLLLMGGNMGSILTVWLFIWMCNSRHCRLWMFGCHPCYAVSRNLKLWWSIFIFCVKTSFRKPDECCVDPSRHGLYMWGEMGFALCIL